MFNVVIFIISYHYYNMMLRHTTLYWHFYFIFNINHNWPRPLSQEHSENPMCNEPCNWDVNHKDRINLGIQYVMGDSLLLEWISNILVQSTNLSHWCFSELSRIDIFLYLLVYIIPWENRYYSTQRNINNLCYSLAPMPHSESCFWSISHSHHVLWCHLLVSEVVVYAGLSLWTHPTSQEACLCWRAQKPDRRTTRWQQWQTAWRWS